MGRLAGKVAVISETEAGIGRATALRFAEEGASVVCADADPAHAEETARLVRAAGGAAVAIGADVTTVAGCEAVADAAVQAFGGVDVLYNNTAMLVRGTVEQTSVEDFDRIFEVNVRPVFLLSRACIPLLRARGGGSIVNLASSLAFIGYAGLPAYTATKGAVRMLSKTMALDHAHEQIRVNCVCHGGIDDPLLRSLFAAQPDPEAALAAFLTTIPAGRLATLTDMANAALFLACDESASTTGSEILVDGGQTAR